MLYLNPKYDVLYVRPEFQPPQSDIQPKPRAATVIVDFLHDIRAHDPRDQRYVVF